MKNVESFTGTYLLSVRTTLPVALATLALSLTTSATGSSAVYAVADFIGSWGNDIFLIGTNIVIFVWAWRRQLRSLIPLTLWLDFTVWLSVQGTKLMLLDIPWALRPDGSPGGFPSGHATHSFAMAFLLTMLFPRFALLWYSSAVAISWSRIETFAHSGGQVAVGVILGVSIGWIMVARWLQRHAAVLQATPAHLEPATSERAL